MGFDAIDAGGGTAVLLLLWALFVTVFWMVVGVRAMKAHERLAAVMARLEELERSRRDGAS